jgi:hypothetical protein
MKGILGFCLLLIIFFACTKTSNTPARVSRGDSSTVTATGPDSIPASISILYGDSLYGTRGYEMPGALAVVVKNKEGILLNGIAVSFSAGVDYGFASSYVPITNPVGFVQFSWTLGMSSDSIQTLKAQVQNNPNISVTFHARTLDIKRYHFVGTLRIVDTTENGTGFGYMEGPPDFPALYDNTDMPFIIDSMTNIISTLGFPMVLTINGHTLTGSAIGNNGKIQDGSFSLGGFASENKSYPNATGGQIYSYGEEWQFSGTLVNNVYSGTFSLRIPVATRAGSGPDIYNIYYLRFGTFTTTIQ